MHNYDIFSSLLSEMGYCILCSSDNYIFHPYEYHLATYFLVIVYTGGGAFHFMASYNGVKQESEAEIHKCAAKGT